jgi:hypothetical protein
VKENYTVYEHVLLLNPARANEISLTRPMSSPVQRSKDENTKVFTMIYPILGLLSFFSNLLLARKTQHRNNLLVSY